MFDELQRLHDEIQGHLDDLDRLTALPEPVCDRISATRYRLTKASRARFLLLARDVYPAVLPDATVAERAAIERLRVEADALIVCSGEHVRSWTIDDIRRRWPDYRTRSAQIRREMRARLAAEQRLLYPLLRDGARGAGRAA